MNDLKIGVIGHRQVTNPAATEESIRLVLEQILNNLSPSEPTQVVFLSSLAEGFDRLVVNWGFHVFNSISHCHNSSLHAVLPFPLDDYADDFISTESKTEFFKLLDCAEEVVVLEGQSRPEAYLTTGRHVVESCDLLFCVWDGNSTTEVAGTFKTLQTSTGKGLNVVWIHSETGELTFGYSGDKDS